MHVRTLGVALLLGVGSGSVARAQEPAPDSAHRLGLQVELGPELLWNPLELSPGALSKLRRDRAADRQSGRFDDVESESDVALRAALEGAWRFEPGPGRALRVWAGADHRQFVRSPRGSYVELAAGAKQELGETMFLRLDASTVPARFHANRLAGADDADGNGSIDNTERRYRGLWSAEGGGRVTFGWRFGDAKPFDWGEVFLGGGVERHRSPFEHRDGTALEAGIAATFGGGRGASTRLGYRFAAFLARPDGGFLLLDEDKYDLDFNGDGDQVDDNVPGVRDVDDSHLDHELEVRWRWAGKRAVGGGLDLELRLRQWTSRETFDRRHEDRLVGPRLGRRLRADRDGVLAVVGRHQPELV